MAPNVIPPHASAELLFRTVGPPEDILRVLEAVEPDGVDRRDSPRAAGQPARSRLPASRRRCFPFTTDVPFLTNWGEPLLFGPGSFLVAHTDHEHLALAELDARDRPATCELARGVSALASLQR